MLSADGQMAIAAAATFYAAILDDIENHDYDVFRRRAFVSKWDKLHRLPRIWWRLKKRPLSDHKKERVDKYERAGEVVAP